MDRLTDIARPVPRNRTDSSDLARTTRTRPERTRLEGNDELETRSSDRTEQRARAEHTSDRQERFKVRVDVQPSAESSSAEAAAASEAVAENQPEDSAREATSSDAKPESDADRAVSPARNAQTKAASVSPEPARVNATLALPEAAPTAKPKDEKAEPVLTLLSPTAEIDSKIAITNQPVAATKAAPTDQAPVSGKAQVEADAGLAPVPTAAPKGADARANPRAGLPTQTSTAADFRVATTPTETAQEPAAPRAAHDVERAADILRQVRVQLSPHTQEAHIQLQPLELGRISIRVSIEEGRMRTTVRAEKQEALSAIEAHLPELRVALRQQGIETSDFQFSLGLDNQPQRDQRQSPSRSSAARTTAVEAGQPEHALLLRATATASGIDLYA